MAEMTIHIRMDYACPGCSAEFIPYSNQSSCPCCNEATEKSFPELLGKCEESIVYNLRTFSRFAPSVWIPLSIGDRVLFDVACALDTWLQFWLHISYSELHRRIENMPAYGESAEARTQQLQKTIDAYFTWFQETYMTDPAPESFRTDRWWLEYIGRIALTIYQNIHSQHLELELLAAARLYHQEQLFDHARKLFRATAFGIYPRMLEAYEGIIDSALDYWQASRDANKQDRRYEVQHWLLGRTLDDYDRAAHAIGDDPEFKRLWADAAFLSLECKEYERAAFLYEKALAEYDSAASKLNPAEYCKVYKLAVSERLRREIRGIGGRHSRRYHFGEATYIDLHCGLALAYDRLGEYDKAIQHLRLAADSVNTHGEELKLGRMQLPFQIGQYGNDQQEILRWAEQTRRKKNRKSMSFWTRLFRG